MVVHLVRGLAIPLENRQETRPILIHLAQFVNHVFLILPCQSTTQSFRLGPCKCDQAMISQACSLMRSVPVRESQCRHSSTRPYPPVASRSSSLHLDRRNKTGGQGQGSGRRRFRTGPSDPPAWQQPSVARCHRRVGPSDLPFCGFPAS